VTHELRGALVGVFARVEALREGFVDDEDTTLRHIDGDLRRLHRLVDDVDRFAEAQRPALLVSKRPIDLGAIVLASIARYADRFSARAITVSERVAGARVEGDPERLAQVVDNLLSNALRYTPAGGHISVQLSAGRGDAVLEVSDTGIGIAPEHVGRIFDRFWRGPEARSLASEGTGVGLALVADLVRAHDGCVEVASIPGRGSTFAVRIPLTDSPVADVTAATPRHAPPAAVPERWRTRPVAGERATAPFAG